MAEKGGGSSVPGTGEATPLPSPGGGSPAPREGEAAEGQADGAAAPATPIEGAQFVTPPPVVSLHLDASYDGEPLRFRSLDDYIGNADAPGLVARVLEEQELHLGSAEEPTTFKEAERDHRWRQALIEGMDSIQDNKTWELVDPPANCRPIELKWVFKVKHNERSNVVKHKARLVAKGFVQREGIDFEEVFAPVAWMESVCLLLALAATKDWEVHHMNVKSAFLNWELVEDVHVQQLPGFIVASEEHKVLRLRKALYGLRQPPHAWNTKLDASLVSLGFTKCVTEHALYTRQRKHGSLIVDVYVDDLIITGWER